MLRRHLLLGSAAALALPGLASAQAQRPIRLVVPFNAGSAIDMLGRLLAERLPAHLGGRQVLVENRAGAGGVAGADHVARSAPDGTTFGILGVTTLCAFPSLYERLPYDPVRDFTPVGQVSAGVELFAVNADIARRRNWTNFASVLRWARTNPAAVKAASAGTGSIGHLLVAATSRLSGVDITHVPYRGAASALHDLLGGIVDMMVDAPATLTPQAGTGPDARLRVFAVSSAEEFPLLPGVPGMRAFREFGLAGLDVNNWNAVMAPPNTPPDQVGVVHAALGAVLQEEGFAARFRQAGQLPVASPSPAALAELIARETPVWARLVEMSGARLTV